MLNLSLLGLFHAQIDGLPILKFGAIKAQALFIYLAVEAQQVHQREALMALLWPDMPIISAQQNLRQALYKLRKTIQPLNEAPFVLAERFTLNWNPAADFSLDLTNFEKLAASSREVDWQAAVELYRGEFLADFYLSDSEPFEAWAANKRAVYHHTAQEVLGRLVTGLTNQHNYEGAIHYARQWLTLDKLHEPVHQALMRLYALSGRQSAALRQFMECQQLLQDELGIEPALETLTLAAAIRERQIKPPVESTQILPPVSRDVDEVLLSDETFSDPHLLFVGREIQLANLEHALEQTLNRQGQLRLITGEAGAGKSALVTEFIHRATTAQAELLVTRGFCDAQTGVVDPYLPFREALRALFLGSSEAVPANAPAPVAGLNLKVHIPPGAREIACKALLEHGHQLLSVVASMSERQTIINTARQAGWQGEVAHALDRSQNFEQHRIFEQSVAVLQAVAARFPLILVLEDLHWADNGSIGILFRLVRQLAGHAILVIGTYRPEAVRPDRQGEDHLLKQMILELQRNLSDFHINLDEARKLEGQRLVDGVLDAEPNRLDASFRQALYHQTGGHPLFVVELVQDLKTSGTLIQNEDGEWVMGGDLDWLSLPNRVEGAIAGRMAHLNETQRWLLAIASVMGESFLVEVVAHVAGEDPRQLTHIFSRILQVEHRLVEAEGVERIRGQRLTRYRFGHNLMQVYLYERLDAVQRVYLHEDVANTLESLYGEEIERIALPLARHFQQAGMTEKAVDYFQKVGESAVRIGANFQGIQHFSQALELLRELPENNERLQQALQMQFDLAEAHTRINQTAFETQEAYTQALVLARQLGDTRKIIQILAALTSRMRSSSQLDLAQIYGEECLSLAKESQDPEFLMMANGALFSLALGLGQYSDAVFHVEEMISFHRNLKSTLSVNDTYNLASNFSYAGLALGPYGFPDRALRYAQEGLALMQQIENHYGHANALGLLATVYERRDEWKEALQLGEAMIVISTAHNFFVARTFGEMHKGACLALLGKPDEGIVFVRRAIAEREAMSMHFAQVGYLARTGLGYGLVGEVEKGLALVNEAIHTLQESNDRQEEALIYRIKGDLLLMQELPADKYAAAQKEAETCFRQAIAIAQEQRARFWEVSALTSLCRLLHSQGRDEGCLQQLADLYAWFNEGHETKTLQLVRTVLAERQ